MDDRSISITTPAGTETMGRLNAGDMVLLSGELLVFRDQVHRNLCDIIQNGGNLPFDIAGGMLYYCGPTPAMHGMAVGSAGPTTSSRMDRFTVPLLERGLLATIGKGNRSSAVVDAMRRYGAVYFVAVGGAGAFLAKRVTASRIIAYPELGPEAARIFTVRDFPLFVAIDSRGESAFAEYHGETRQQPPRKN